MSELPDESRETSPDISPAVDRLKALDPAAVKAALDRELEAGSVDPDVGIVIADLADVEPVEIGGTMFRFHGGRILPRSSGGLGYVKPHVHAKGEEPYIMLDLFGAEMNTGNVEGERVVWDGLSELTQGQVFVVKEGQVHSLRNTSEKEPFDFAFACPDSHLETQGFETPQGDRVFTDHLDNPLPPHYASAS